MPAGIEAMNAYLGQAVLNARTSFGARGLDMERFDNLMREEKSVCLPHAEITTAKRVGLYSYGSGCSSEFYSGIITPQSQAKLRSLKIETALNQRYSLNMGEYDPLVKLNSKWRFGIKDAMIDYSEFAAIYDKQLAGKGLLALKAIDKNYHRKYGWS